MPNHSLTLALLRALSFPLAAPSANPFGYISPTTAGHVADQLGDQVPYILDGGPAAVGLESTIVGFENGQTEVFRLGGLALESIERIAGPVSVRTHSTSNPKAPGMLSSRALDALDLDVIYAEPLPNQGLGPAMNDRLRRAAVR